MTSAITTEPVSLDWEGYFTQRLDLLLDAIHRGEPALLSAMEVHDRLSDVDHAATLRNKLYALPQASLDDTEQKMHEIETVLLSVAETAKKGYEAVIQEMADFAASTDATKQDKWENLLHECATSMMKLNQKLVQVPDKDMRLIIASMPPDVQDDVAWLARKALATNLEFPLRAQRSFLDARDNIDEWVRNPSQKIKNFSAGITTWFNETCAKIKELFPSGLTAHLSGFEIIPSANYSSSEDITSWSKTLWKSGYNVVRKGSFWVVESM